MTERERTLTITRQTHSAGPILLRLEGELDYHTASQLTRAINDIPFAPGTHVLFDLQALDYCDSTGLTAFVTAYHRAAAAGSALELAGLKPHVTRVFNITGLDRFLTLHTSAEQALDRLRW